MSVLRHPPEISGVIYRGDRVILRLVSPEDAELIYSWGDDFLATYRPGLDGVLCSPEDWRRRLRVFASFPEPIETEVIAVHPPTGVPFGSITLSGIDRWHGKAELSAGFVHGRGTRAAWEAIHFALNQAFVALGLRKLIFYTLEENRAARAVMDHLGAHFEGLLREELVRAPSGVASLCRYALFRNDWPRVSAMLNRLAPLRQGPVGMSD